ncbi:MAG: hypothetical protein Q4Q62_06535 [Thermoplasmata archaeon]|nr:hypothetical protein [Thermoplasmata archaeon]
MSTKDEPTLKLRSAFSDAGPFVAPFLLLISGPVVVFIEHSSTESVFVFLFNTLCCLIFLFSMCLRLQTRSSYLLDEIEDLSCDLEKWKEELEGIEQRLRDTDAEAGGLDGSCLGTGDDAIDDPTTDAAGGHRYA